MIFILHNKIILTRYQYCWLVFSQQDKLHSCTFAWFLLSWDTQDDMQPCLPLSHKHPMKFSHNNFPWDHSVFSNSLWTCSRVEIQLLEQVLRSILIPGLLLTVIWIIYRRLSTVHVFVIDTVHPSPPQYGQHPCIFCGGGCTAAPLMWLLVFGCFWLADVVDSTRRFFGGGGELKYLDFLFRVGRFYHFSSCDRGKESGPSISSPSSLLLGCFCFLSNVPFILPTTNSCWSCRKSPALLMQLWCQNNIFCCAEPIFNNGITVSCFTKMFQHNAWPKGNCTCII